MTENKELWILKGYEAFALNGPVGLKIEPLAKEVGKSKSSFYHHYADLELFTEELLKFHLEQSLLIAEKEKTALKVDPDLINILVDHRIDLLFSRQLRINQQHPQFATTLAQSNKIVGDTFIKVWAKDLQLNLSHQQLSGMFSLAQENFYLQINIEHLNYEWLSSYFSNLRQVVATLKS